MKKAYPIEIVLSLTTGFLLKHQGFAEMHELAEHVLGHSVWTHEFADEQLVQRMAVAVFRQHPALRDAEAFDVSIKKEKLDEYLAAYVARAVTRYGAFLDIERGTDQRTESPLVSGQRLMDGRPVIGVSVDGEVRSAPRGYSRELGKVLQALRGPSGGKR